MPDKYMDDSEINSEPDKYIIERTLIMNMEQALENAKLIRELQMQNDIKKMANGSKKSSSVGYERAPFEPEEGSFGEWVLKAIFFGALIFLGFAIFTLISEL